MVKIVIFFFFTLHQTGAYEHPGSPDHIGPDEFHPKDDQFRSGMIVENESCLKVEGNLGDCKIVLKTFEVSNPIIDISTIYTYTVTLPFGLDITSILSQQLEEALECNYIVTPATCHVQVWELLEQMGLSCNITGYHSRNNYIFYLYGVEFKNENVYNLLEKQEILDIESVRKLNDEFDRLYRDHARSTSHRRKCYMLGGGVYIESINVTMIVRTNSDGSNQILSVGETDRGLIDVIFNDISNKVTKVGYYRIETEILIFNMSCNKFLADAYNASEADINLFKDNVKGNDRFTVCDTIDARLMFKPLSTTNTTTAMPTISPPMVTTTSKTTITTTVFPNAPLPGKLHTKSESKRNAESSALLYSLILFFLFW